MKLRKLSLCFDSSNLFIINCKRYQPIAFNIGLLNFVLHVKQLFVTFSHLPSRTGRCRTVFIIHCEHINHLCHFTLEWHANFLESIHFVSKKLQFNCDQLTIWPILCRVVITTLPRQSSSGRNSENNAIFHYNYMLACVQKNTCKCVAHHFFNSSKRSNILNTFAIDHRILHYIKRIALLESIVDGYRTTQ